MPGTKHFTRMQYHVARGLREIIAPRQTMPARVWNEIKAEFGGKCVFCGQSGTHENRGIVPDHIIPVTQFGELVSGNTVPACQTCNDSRGDKDWRAFMRQRFVGDAETQVLRLERYIARHAYQPVHPSTALSAEELVQYTQLLQGWSAILEQARRLQASAMQRRQADDA